MKILKYKKVFAFIFAVLFLIPALAASASALILIDGEYYESEEEYNEWLRVQKAAERTSKISSFIIGGALIPIVGLVFFAVMWIKKSMPASRCAFVVISLIVYVGVRVAYLCVTL